MFHLNQSVYKDSMFSAHIKLVLSKYVQYENDNFRMFLLESHKTVDIY